MRNKLALQHSTELFITIGGRDVYDSGLTVDRPLFERRIDIYAILQAILWIVAIVATCRSILASISFYIDDLTLRLKTICYIFSLAIGGVRYVEA